MSGIFISYRRDDVAGDAGRLFDDLARRCRRDRVFIDLEIPPGIDFRSVLADKLQVCDVVFAVIGPRWLEARNAESGTRRLDDPGDYVRMEIEVALEKGKTVIPLILPGARIPRPEELPETMRGLAWRNAFDLRRDRWTVDLNALVGQLPAKLRCGEELPNGLPARVLVYVLAMPIVLLSALHVFTVFRLETLDPQIPSVVASLALGAAHTLWFRLRLWQKLLVGAGIAFASVLLDSVLVPVLAGDRILPRGAEIGITLQTIASFVAGRLAGYLVGALVGEALLSRGGSRRG
jgi:hypothetical protein